MLSEWACWDGEKHPFIGAKMVQVDGEKYKADTWYTLKDGKVVEVDNGVASATDNNVGDKMTPTNADRSLRRIDFE